MAKISNFKLTPRRKKIIILVFLNIVCISALVLLTTFYGKLFFNEVKYAFKSLFDEDVKNSQKYYEALPHEIATSKKFLLEPIVEIPVPEDESFSIIIPKIDVNKRVIPNVDINNPAEVDAALKEGVGWAKGTVAPGEQGNSLLFSHSTQNSWDIFTYNAVFSMLRKLEVNDVFTIVYQGRQMDFIVFEKSIVPPDDTSYVTAQSDYIMVTLQTCDPPGSNEARLLVRGRLVAISVKKG